MATDIGTRSLTRMVRRHWGTIALFCLSAVANAVLITYLLDESYEASTLVLITPQPDATFGRQTADPKELLSFPVSSVGTSTQTETSTKTYSALIKSWPVIERVVRNLRLDEPPTEEAAPSAVEKLVDDAKDLLGKSKQILMHGRLLEGDPAEEIRGRLISRVSVSPTRNSYVFSIDCVWEDPQIAAAIANDTAEAFVDMLGEMSSGEATRVREFVGQRLEESKVDLAAARTALQEFKQETGVVAFDAETTEEIRLIADLSSSLELVNSRLSGLLDQLAPTSPKVLQLEAERDSLIESIERRRAAMAGLPDAEARLATLELNARSAEAVVELIALEYENARIVEINHASDVRVVAPALVPSAPVEPIVILYAAVALLIAMLVGIGTALAVEIANPRLCEVDQVREELELPVLATVPKVRALSGR